MRAWDRKMIHHIQNKWGESLDFFAHFNDGYVGERLPTVSIMGLDYYNRDKYIYEHGYKSFSCDAEAMYVAMMRKRYHYFKELLFKHEHPANSRYNRYDALYKENSLHTNHDTPYYFARLNNYFGEPVTEDTPIPYASYINTVHTGSSQAVRPANDRVKKTVHRKAGGIVTKPRKTS